MVSIKVLTSDAEKNLQMENHVGDAQDEARIDSTASSENSTASHDTARVDSNEVLSSTQMELLQESRPIPRPWRHPIRFTGWMIQGAFGLASLVFLLAVLAAIPIVNILALGYLLDAEGRVARTGKITQGFPLFPQAKRLGGIMIGVMIFLLPLRYLGGFTTDAEIVDPNSINTHIFELLTFVTAVIIFSHLLFALGRGGSLSCFFRPVKNVKWMIGQLSSRNYLIQASASVREFVKSLRLVESFKLGFLGAIGVLMWTFFPTLLYSAADSSEGIQVLVTMFGGLLLILVVSWLPALQAGYACEGKFSAYKQLGEARLLFRRTPMLWTLALLLGYALSLVLYLFKIAAPPQDGLWMMTIVFIAAIYPARIFIAWVYARSKRIETQPHFLWRWLWSLTTVGLCGFYVMMLFFARDIGANGKVVLYEQPLLMIPSPF